MHEFITHIVYDGKLPENGNKKQVSPICSSVAEMESGFYFLGYSGKKKFMLSELNGETLLHLLPERPEIKKHCTIWVDTEKKVYYRDELQPSSWEHIGTLIN